MEQERTSCLVADCDDPVSGRGRGVEGGHKVALVPGELVEVGGLRLDGHGGAGQVGEREAEASCGEQLVGLVVDDDEGDDEGEGQESGEDELVLDCPRQDGGRGRAGGRAGIRLKEESERARAPLSPRTKATAARPSSSSSHARPRSSPTPTPTKPLHSTMSDAQLENGNTVADTNSALGRGETKARRGPSRLSSSSSRLASLPPR